MDGNKSPTGADEWRKATLRSSRPNQRHAFRLNFVENKSCAKSLQAGGEGTHFTGAIGGTNLDLRIHNLNTRA